MQVNFLTWSFIIGLGVSTLLCIALGVYLVAIEERAKKALVITKSSIQKAKQIIYVSGLMIGISPGIIKILSFSDGWEEVLIVTILITSLIIWSGLRSLERSLTRLGREHSVEITDR